MKKRENNCTVKKKLKKIKNKSIFLKKSNIYMYNSFNSMKKNNKKKLSKNSKIGINIVFNFLKVMIFRNDPETLGNIMSFLTNILNLILDKI